jgi:hypothetical protein
MTCEPQLRVGTDARGSGCWEVVIDGTLHQDPRPGPLWELIERWRAKQPVPSLIARWARLPHVEGLCNCSGGVGCNRCMDAPTEPDPQ